jgi:hypothetical protein
MALRKLENTRHKDKKKEFSKPCESGGKPTPLAGNVADMLRHVADDTLCRSNFGQMGPCRRHNFFDVVAVCVGYSRHLLDFSEFVYRNILLWYGSTYAQIPNTHFCHVLHSVMFSSCHANKNREHSQFTQ